MMEQDSGPGKAGRALPQRGSGCKGFLSTPRDCRRRCDMRLAMAFWSDLAAD